MTKLREAHRPYVKIRNEAPSNVRLTVSESSSVCSVFTGACYGETPQDPVISLRIWTKRSMCMSSAAVCFGVALHVSAWFRPGASRR